MRSRFQAARAGGPMTLAVVLLAACGEPAVDLEIPARDASEDVLDTSDLLDDGIAARLEEFEAVTGLDAVALTYESEQASRGEASRAGRLLVERWGADLALVAVARPGDFASTVVDRDNPEDRARYFGVEPADPFAVPGDLRERVVEEIVPPIAADNRWDDVFATAVEELQLGIAAEGEQAS